MRHVISIEYDDNP